MNHLSEYEKMASGLKELVSDELTFNRLNKLDWVVTEKVHGANFRFIYQDKKLQFGKRKELLSWTDDFFGFQTMVVRLERQIIELLEQVQLEYNSTKIIVYGELFGGTYPHSGVPVNSSVSAIQTGIFYSPNIEFYAFDISIENENPSLKCYLDYQKALPYFENFNILHARPLKLGKLSEVLNFDLRMETTIPQYLNLPAINGNFIEGIVIKPFNYSPTALFEIRPIIKIKNPEFEENRKFHQAQKWSYKTKMVSFSQDLDFLLDDLRNYITENRLNNAVSKIGALSSKDLGRMRMIEKEFLEDVFIDFNNYNGQILKELDDEQNKWIMERVKADILQLISIVTSKNNRSG